MTMIDCSTRPNADRLCRSASTGHDDAWPNAALTPRIVCPSSPLDAARLVPDGPLGQGHGIDPHTPTPTPLHTTPRVALKSP